MFIIKCFLLPVQKLRVIVMEGFTHMSSKILSSSGDGQLLLSASLLLWSTVTIQRKVRAPGGFSTSPSLVLTNCAWSYFPPSPISTHTLKGPSYGGEKKITWKMLHLCLIYKQSNIKYTVVYFTHFLLLARRRSKHTHHAITAVGKRGNSAAVDYSSCPCADWRVIFLDARGDEGWHW